MPITVSGIDTVKQLNEYGGKWDLNRKWGFADKWTEEAVIIHVSNGLELKTAVWSSACIFIQIAVYGNIHSYVNKSVYTDMSPYSDRWDNLEATTQ